MVYFVASDIHGYYSQFKQSLAEAGFDFDNEDHKIILCGDAFDRGSEASKLVDYLVRLYDKGKLIYIRGNHEDLLLDCLHQLKCRVNISQHHWTNKTLNTIAQLTGIDEYSLACGCYNYEKDIEPKMQKCLDLIAKSINYYQDGDYIFVHGWLPSCEIINKDNYQKLLDTASIENWEIARWLNGMEEWHNKNTIQDKTIVCGHWHCSYGNSRFHGEGEEDFSEDANFNPFIDNGIIALDSCVAYSNKINVVKITV